MFLKLTQYPNILSREYYEWDGNGDGLSPLGACWAFQRTLEPELRRITGLVAPLSHVEEPAQISQLMRETLFRCQFRILENIDAALNAKRRNQLLAQRGAATNIISVWTDGAFDHRSHRGGIGYVIAVDDNPRTRSWSKGVHPIFSSFQAETEALVEALKYVVNQEHDITEREVWIYSDAQSLLRHLQGILLGVRFVGQPILEIIHWVTELFNNGAQAVTFNWGARPYEYRPELN